MMHAASQSVEEAITLLDWKRAISELYAEIRSEADAATAWSRWRAVREGLFRTHAQSPVPAAERPTFSGARYFPYDPAARVVANVVPREPEPRRIATSTGVTISFTRFAQADFELYGTECSLELYWLDGYGGGLFLPFGDSTAEDSTFPAGRYLLDTVKGADLGSDAGGLVLDFNFAFNPSCAYDPGWVCPLAPTANWLPFRVEAGEQTP